MKKKPKKKSSVNSQKNSSNSISAEESESKKQPSGEKAEDAKKKEDTAKPEKTDGAKKKEDTAKLEKADDAKKKEDTAETEKNEITEGGREAVKRKLTPLDVIIKIFYYAIPAAMLFIVPFLNFYLLQSYIRYDIKTPELKFLNILFFELFAIFLVFITNRIRVGLLIETCITFAFGILEYFVVSFRTTPILPWDIFSIGTALNVAGNYEFKLTAEARKTTISFVCIIAVLIAMCFFYKKQKIFKNLKARIATIAVSFAAFLSFSITCQSDKVMEWGNYYPYQYTPLSMMRKNGIAVTLLYDVKFLKLSKPDGYSASNSEKLLKNYEQTIPDTDEKYPNVIAIMNETWSDLEVLEQPFTTNEPVMPFISSLMESDKNTISGSCHVSIVGGNTANSEYEFITGNTMRFMPDGSIPFMSYIKEGTPSVFSHVEDLGYETYFIHPNYERGWNRKNVYTNFGVDNLWFNDIDGDDSIVSPCLKRRNYTTDQTLFSRIEDIFAKKDKDESIYAWAVTIQNHGGYTGDYEDFEPNIKVDGVDSKALEVYLSLMNLTDRYFQELIEYFENYDEDTIIVMFGDHQPNDSVVQPLYKLNGNSVYDATAEETELRYITPYVIWANFDIDGATDVETSANYLSSQTLQAAGIPLSDYDNYLLELASEVPVLSNASMKNSDGESVSPDDEKYAEKIDEYRKLAYYRLTDCKTDSK